MEEKEVMAEVAEAAEAAEGAVKKGGATEMDRVLTTKDMVVQGMAWLCPACITMYYGIINK